MVFLCPALLQSAVSRLVKPAGADTTLKNAIRDGAEFAWIPHGDTCAFCLMLASRGWQKAGKRTLKNGHAEHIHANCDCEYAVRFNASTTVLYYNKDAVKKAGGDPDHFPTTWPEVAELAKKIKESGACKYGLTSGWQSWVQLESFSAWHNVPFATNNNGYDGLDTKLLFNSPLHVKHIDFLSKLQKDGVMVYVGRKSEAINAFTSGEAGILMNSSGSYAAVKAGAKFQWGVALLPYWPDVKGAPQNTVIGGAAIWAMAGHSKDAEKGAAAFLNYLLKPEVQARFHQLTGYVPVTLEGYELTKQQGFYDKNPGTDIAVKALSDKKPTINSLGLRLGNFVQIRNIIDEELEAVWAGKKTAKQALDAAVERGNAELARFAKANKK